MGLIYLDNAATSFPKPPAVAESIVDFLEHGAGNPGRSGHVLAIAAQTVVAATRSQLAALFAVPDPARIVFALNATDALNMALWGILRPGDRVVTTSIEHNAVARPLYAMAERGIEVTRVACSPDGTLDLDDLDRALRSAPVRLVAMCHASNVVGTILPVQEAAQRAHEHGALFLLDAAQTAGVLPIDVGEMGLDLLAFPGHKALLGPTGTGGSMLQRECGCRRCARAAPAPVPRRSASQRSFRRPSRSAPSTPLASRGWARPCATSSSGGSMRSVPTRSR